MAVNIDYVLKPYEDSQPTNLSMCNRQVERIPLLIDPNTGHPTPKFQKFYDNIVTNCSDRVWFGLYDISDKCISREDFNSLWLSNIRPLWAKYVTADSNKRGLDIELNLDRFQQSHRNLIGGFFIIFYVIDLVETELCDYPRPNLKQYKTELLFTYKDDEFKLLSILNPFTEAGE